MSLIGLVTSGNYSATTQSSDSEKPTSSIRSPRRDGRVDRRTPLFALPARGRGERPGREPHRSPPPGSPAQQFNKVCFPARAPFGGCRPGKWLSPSACGCRFRSGVGVEGAGARRGGGPVSVVRGAGPALSGGGAAAYCGTGRAARCCLCSPGWGGLLCVVGAACRSAGGGGWGFPAGPPGQGMALRRPGPAGLAAGAGKGQAAMARGGRHGSAGAGLRVRKPGAGSAASAASSRQEHLLPQQAGSCGPWAQSFPLPTLGSLLSSPCLFYPGKKCTVSACRRSASQP